MPLQHIRTTPILRSFDETKAKEFYLGFLGFQVDWEHRFSPDLPLFMQVSRSGIQLWLSEHHGDGTPGALVTIEVTDLRAYHAELTAKKYRNARPGLGQFVGGGIEMELSDPAGNRLNFVEREPVEAVLGAASPFFIIRDLASSLAFYRDRLGFSVVFSEPAADAVFAIVKRGTAQLMLKAIDPSLPPLPNPVRHPLARWDTFIATPVPSALMSEFQGRGVECTVPLENKDDGLQGFQVKDPDGYVVYFGCPV